MGHVHMDIILKAQKGEKKLEKVLVDTGATYTFVEKEVLEEIGAPELPTKIEVELGDGKKVLAKAYGAILKYEEKEAPIIVLTFPGAKRVIGVEALESLGLRVDPVTHKLEYTREKGIAYFY